MIRFPALIFYLCCILSCKSQTPIGIIKGADQITEVVAKLKGKKVGLVVNHTALVGKTHLADTLKSLEVNIIRIFGPEHGFRGDAADGEHVNDSVDARTKIPVVSLYGKNRKPTSQQLTNLDVIVFDIQDVGARFYTYIGTLHYVMEACAENNKNLLVLDRPNPNSYVDGPILQPEFKSFVGMHPVPITHGMTIGEFSLMINGEGWLDGGKKCNLDIIQLKNWTHADDYSVPVKPSPNLPNDQAVRLYPSLCLFEGTAISLGRGTTFPFLVLGNPEFKNVDGMTFTFTPTDIKGMAIDPPHKNQLCYGIDLRKAPVERKVNLQYLLDFYKIYPDKDKFFIKSFDRLAGGAILRQQIMDGLTEAQIRDSWKEGLAAFSAIRKKYLLYP